MRKARKGQAALQGLPSSAIFIGVAVVVVALLITVLAGLQTSLCTTNDGTEGTYTNSSATGPTTGTYTDCCLTINASDGYDCDTWYGSEALNASYTGQTGLGTFNDYWSVLVLIVVLAIVIAALYMIVPRSAGY